MFYGSFDVKEARVTNIELCQNIPQVFNETKLPFLQSQREDFQIKAVLKIQKDTSSILFTSIIVGTFYRSSIILTASTTFKLQLLIQQVCSNPMFVLCIYLAHQHHSTFSTCKLSPCSLHNSPTAEATEVANSKQRSNR